MLGRSGPEKQWALKHFWYKFNKVDILFCILLSGCCSNRSPPGSVRAGPGRQDQSHHPSQEQGEKEHWWLLHFWLSSTSLGMDQGWVTGGAQLGGAPGQEGQGCDWLTSSEILFFFSVLLLKQRHYFTGFLVLKMRSIIPTSFPPFML